MEMVIEAEEILRTTKQAAQTAAADYIADWQAQTGGNAYGEPMYCGFAWVTVSPEFQHKGNTRLGKDERREFAAVMTALGLELDYTGRAYQLWNPAGWGGQSMDVKLAGARAAAQVLRDYGFRAYAGSRAD